MTTQYPFGQPYRVPREYTPPQPVQYQLVPVQQPAQYAPVQQLAQPAQPVQYAPVQQPAQQPVQVAQPSPATTPQQITAQSPPPTDTAPQQTAVQSPSAPTATSQQTATQPTPAGETLETAEQARELPENQQAELGQERAQRQFSPEQPQPATSPYIDLYESPETFTVFADLPGCREEDITIQKVDNNIRIIGDRPFEIEGEAQPLQDERAPRIERTIDIPTEVDVEEAEATFENGVCKITLPKTEESRPKTIGFH